MGWFSVPKPRTKVKPEDRAAEARARVVREQSRAGAAVISEALSEVGKLKEIRRGIARAQVEQAAAEMKAGKSAEAVRLMGEALGKRWARKLRVAISPRVPRPNRKRQSDAGGIPPMSVAG